MPPFSSQFGLSHELERLLPSRALSAANNGTTEAVLKYARKLQNSGSDLATEEDLKGVFGRVVVDRTLEDAFKAGVRAASKSHQLDESIALVAGIGPTVESAFAAENVGGFAMVVQLSLLASIHSIDSIASALTYHYHALATEAYRASSEADDDISYPDQGKIRDVITASQEQTTAWDWEHYLYTVADRLDITENTDFVWPVAKKSINGLVFSGLIQFLPLAQRFPEGYRIEIRGPDLKSLGACAIIVWAHFVLGMNVKVSKSPGRSVSDVQFPPDSSRHTLVIIEDRATSGDAKCSVVLYKSTGSAEKKLFSIDPATNFVPLHASKQESAKGWGARRLLASFSIEQCRTAVAVELSLIRCGIALHFVDHLVYSHPDEPPTRREERDQCMLRPAIPESVFVTTARFLFDFGYLPSHFTFESMRERKCLVPSLAQAPAIVKAYMASQNDTKTQSDLENDWRVMYSQILDLAILLLSMCHIQDIKACNRLTFANHPPSSEVLTQLSMWDGRSRVYVAPDTWFNYIRMFIDEDAKPTSRGDLVLISRRGWSVFANTFGNPDPPHIKVGRFSVQEGVPCRHGCRKRSVYGEADSLAMPMKFSIFRHDGQVMLDRTMVDVEFASALVSQDNDSFVVRLRFRYETNMLETSYQELSDSLWCLNKSQPCNHGQPHQTKFTLEHDTALVKDYGGLPDGRPSQLSVTRIWVLPTAGDNASRWYSLWWLWQNPWDLKDGILIRTADCCIPCAIAQATNRPGPWCVIT